MDCPIFKYHPNAYKLEVFKKSKKVCQCCEHARGMIYTSSIFCEADVDAICPWCIADGSAAKKFDGGFIQRIEEVDDYFTPETSLNPTIIHELSQCTPGYVSWQGSVWLTHCNDGCEFHGDLAQNELLTLPEETLNLFKQEHAYLFSPKNWGTIEALNAVYCPASDTGSLYKFVCRHCGFIRLHFDSS
jgi:uncharacterized protein